MANNLLTQNVLDPKTGQTVQPSSRSASGAVNQAANTPQPIQMTYTDPTGQRVTGYSINDRMYKDAAGTQRIDNGSLVTNASGTQTWIMTDQGGIPYQSWLAQQAAQQQQQNYLDDAKAAAIEAANQRLEADILAIEQYRPKYNQQYDDLARQNYQSYMTGREALANQLASQGLYNSGYSDTAQVQQTTSYREQQNQNERARLQALADLDNQIAVARLNGSANLNELEAQYAQLLQEQANADRAFAWEQALHAYDVSRDAISDERYLDERDYARSQDALDEAWRQKEWDYGVSRDAIEDERYLDERDYARSQDALDEAWRQKEWDYGVSRDAIEDERYLDERDYARLQDDKAWAWKEKEFNYNASQDALRNYYTYGGGSKSSDKSIDSSLSQDDKAELYLENPEKYEEVLAIALGFANNQSQIGQTESDAEARIRVWNQLDGYQDWLTNKYGAEYYELYRDTVINNIPWLGYAVTGEPEYQPVLDFNDVKNTVYDMLYDDQTSSLTTNPTVRENVVSYINSLGLSNEDMTALLQLYQLTDTFNNMSS